MTQWNNEIMLAYKGASEHVNHIKLFLLKLIFDMSRLNNEFRG